MCGISGYFSPSNEININKFYQSHKSLQHRGPDDEGFIYDNNGDLISLRGNDTINSLSSLRHVNTLNGQSTKFIFSHRRLSIIDLSFRGHQPYQFDNLVMTYNGEVYNFVEIRDILVSYGYKFESRTDTEVVLKAFHKFGVEAFKKFNGMWALSIFDKRSKKITLSRDRFGKKPLFYNYDSNNNSIFFASEMKAIKKYIKTTFNETAIKRYLRYGENQNSKDTFFNEIKILQPSNYLEFDFQGIKINKYYDIEKKEICESFEELEKLMHSSIQLRLRCDVPISAALSGGFDSSTIVSFLNDNINNKKLHTFTAYFPGIEDKEKKIADDMLKKVNVIPHFISPTTNDFLSDFKNMMYHQEQPVMGVAIFVHWLIMKEVSKYDLKVFYSGHGGDELFGGYYSHYISYILNDFVEFKIKDVILKSKKFIEIRPGIRNYILSLVKSLLIKKLKLSYFRSYKHSKYLNFIIDPTIYKSQFSEDLLKSEMYNQIKSYPLNEWLQYEDRNTMAFSIESRVPLLDYRIVEYAFNITNNIKFYDGDYKYLLRRLGKERLPNSLLTRKDKQGFTTNNFFDDKNFKDFFSDYLINSKLRDFNFFKHSSIKKTVDSKIYDKDDRELWNVFNFSYWLNETA